jgi:hypothetical protein
MLQFDIKSVESMIVIIKAWHECKGRRYRRQCNQVRRIIYNESAQSNNYIYIYQIYIYNYIYIPNIYITIYIYTKYIYVTIYIYITIDR